MEEIILNYKNYTAIFRPDRGMNLSSFAKVGVEALDLSTLSLFEERMAGLGALIGPHFHHRKEADIPSFPLEDYFPHIAKLKTQEPFSHGIGRYVPWAYQLEENAFVATLKGSDEIGPYTLSQLEGFDFQMELKGFLNHQGLHLDYSIESEKPSVIGFHYYYATSEEGRVEAPCEAYYREAKGLIEIPREWKEGERLCYLLNRETDFTFRPPSGKRETAIELKTPQQHLRITYKAYQDEHAWQLYHPKGATFVCIEPVSAQNPREARSLKSRLEITVEIL